MNIVVPANVQKRVFTKERKQAVADLQQAILEHAHIEIEVPDLDGQISRKTRLLAVLDKLFEKGAMQGDVRALAEYLDRVVGRPKQEMDLDLGSGGFSLWELAQMAAGKAKDPNDVESKQIEGEIVEDLEEQANEQESSDNDDDSDSEV